MTEEKYICMSHADWNKEPFGEVFFYHICDAAGLVRREFCGTGAEAAAHAKAHGLTAISPARLFNVWREHWPDFMAFDAAQKALNGASEGDAFRAFNPQFPMGRECATVKEAETLMRGWRTAWVEDSTGAVVRGSKPEGGFNVR